VLSCRIYLFTYKRNQLLPRAIKSLLDQTFTHWVCEIHNDDPSDPFPGQYVSALQDTRFTLVHHAKNLGAIQSFNLAFAGCEEAYFSLLEDDNWWEPTFLEKAIDFLTRNPSVQVVWSNMRLWQELSGNAWRNTQQTTWPIGEDQLFQWNEERQVMGHLHSNGAMVCRNDVAPCLVPKNTLFNAVEGVRERQFHHPIALLAEPLANFSITLTTNRSPDSVKWIATQVMMLASYIVASPEPDAFFAKSLRYHRKLCPNPVANFYMANELLIKRPELNRFFMFRDWCFIVRWIVRNSWSLIKIKRYITANLNVYNYLLEHTRVRFEEARTKR